MSEYVIRIEKEDFHRAKGVISPRVQQILQEIRKNACFQQKEIPFNPKLFSTKHHDRYRNQSKGNHRHHVRRSQPVEKPRTLMIGRDIPQDKRCINDNINKVTNSNYGVVSKRLKIVLDDNNLEYGISEILDKSYYQVDRSELYVELIIDIVNALNPAQRVLVQELLQRKLSESLDDETVYPHVDPVGDYENFCKIVKKKAKAVGRCNTFSRMMKRITKFFKYTPEDYYDHHENLMLKYVDNDRQVEVDIAASIETVLDCLKVIIDHYSSLRNKFQESLCSMKMEDFPSNKCRFKVLDILGR